MNDGSVKKIAIISDAYFPHVSGVATTIRQIKNQLDKRGYEVKIIAPRDFYSIPIPTYPEIQISLTPYKRLSRMLDDFNPDAIHIAVEASLGLAARSYCQKRNIRFTTAFHTKLPEYIQMRTKVPTDITYKYLQWFHKAAESTLVGTNKQELKKRGFNNLITWPKGVDTKTFTPENPKSTERQKPIYMFMGRIAREKNISEFLKLDLKGTKYIVGDGPKKEYLEEKFPNVIFTGYQFGSDLASYLAMADVFVFPSRTDTFGLAMLEANACGTPIAALPSKSSNMIIQEGVNGVISKNLKRACRKALQLSSEDTRKQALSYGWQKPTDIFEDHLVPTS